MELLFVPDFPTPPDPNTTTLNSLITLMYPPLLLFTVRGKSVSSLSVGARVA